MPTYKTFLRSCTSWQQFGSARKVIQDRGLTYEEARRACQAYNAKRTARQVERGNKMEFTQED